MRKKFLWIFVLISILLTFTDLLFLNWQVLKPINKVEISSEVSEVLPTPVSTEIPTSCPSSCLAQIYEPTSSIAKATPPPKAASLPINKQQEFSVYLGSGSSQAADWEDITGALTYIDSSKYGKIKNTVFEAAVQIPNGDQGVYVRLFDKTDGHPVWFSEVYLEGGTPKLLTSQPITLDNGNKLYQVQMKTTLQHLGILNQARIRITTE